MSEVEGLSSCLCMGQLSSMSTYSSVRTIVPGNRTDPCLNEAGIHYFWHCWNLLISLSSISFPSFSTHQPSKEVKQLVYDFMRNYDFKHHIPLTVVLTETWQLERESTRAVSEELSVFLMLWSFRKVLHAWMIQQ